MTTATAKEPNYGKLSVIALVVIAVILALAFIPQIIQNARQADSAVKATAAKGTEAVKQGAENIGNAVEKATAPASTSPQSQGTDGVIAMIKSDPLYDGSPVTTVARSDWKVVTEGGIENMVSMGTKVEDLVVVEYKGNQYFFFPQDNAYHLRAFQYDAGGMKVPVSIGDWPTNPDSPLTAASKAQ